MLVSQPANLLLGQPLKSAVTLPLSSDCILVLAVEEANGGQREAEQLEREVDGMAYVKLWRVRREICPSIRAKL